MDKVELFIATNPGENPRRLLEIEAVPADVRHRKINVEPSHHTRNEAQTLDTGGFFAAFEQGL